MAEEIIFSVQKSPEGGYETKALSAPIFTEADNVEELPSAVRDATECHLGKANIPSSSDSTSCAMKSSPYEVGTPSEQRYDPASIIFPFEKGYSQTSSRGSARIWKYTVELLQN